MPRVMPRLYVPARRELDSQIDGGITILTCRVIADPGDTVWQGGIDAHGSEKRASVPGSRVVTPQQHAEANRTQERHDDVADASLPGAVCDEADSDRQKGGGGVRSNAEKLCLSRFISYSR